MSLPLRSAFATSMGRTTSRDALILRLRQDGIEALSECVTSAVPSSTGEDNATALRAVKEGFEEELRRGAPTPNEFLRATRRVKGSIMARAALEMLLWDFAAKRAGRPLDQMLGESRGYAQAGISLGLGGSGETARRIEDALRLGYKRIKVKIEKDSASERLSRIRDEFPGIPLSADANGCFDFPHDLAILKQLDRFDLQYLEQPLAADKMVETSMLAKEMATQICLDESVNSLDDARKALRSGAATVINVKPGRVGGLSVAREIVKLAKAEGGHVWVGGMLETGVGRAFNIALASLKAVDYPGDTSPNERYFRRDLVKNPFSMDGYGTVRANKGPGIGVELDRAFLTRRTMRVWSIL